MSDSAAMQGLWASSDRQRRTCLTAGAGADD